MKTSTFGGTSFSREREVKGLKFAPEIRRKNEKTLDRFYRYFGVYPPCDIQDYSIDLVFYNHILKCFVLIDLKMGKIAHQDVGQMDMYVKIFNERERGPDDNPTIGIPLYSEIDADVARYSNLQGNDHLS